MVTLYPDVMNIYADRGNLIALRARRRARRRLRGAPVGSATRSRRLPTSCSSAAGRTRAAPRRARPRLEGRALREWVEADVAILAVCGGFQLFGDSYRTAAGEELPGVGIFDVTTVAPPPGAPRCIGDVLAEREAVGEVVGFENHGGRTYLGPTARPFARVRFGFGNNGDDGTEGAVYLEAIGTYLHGSVLPKNPAVTDRLILAALRHRYDADVSLDAMPHDAYAQRAHDAAAAVARARARRAV